MKVLSSAASLAMIFATVFAVYATAPKPCVVLATDEVPTASSDLPNAPVVDTLFDNEIPRISDSRFVKRTHHALYGVTDQRRGITETVADYQWYESQLRTVAYQGQNINLVVMDWVAPNSKHTHRAIIDGGRIIASGELREVLLQIAAGRGGIREYSRLHWFTGFNIFRCDAKGRKVLIEFVRSKTPFILPLNIFFSNDGFATRTDCRRK